MRRSWPGYCCCLAVLAACGPDPDAVGRPMTAGANEYLVPSDPCGAGRLRHLAGQDASALTAAALPSEYRIVYPWNEGGGAFQSDRLTVTVDEATRITRIACG